MLEVEIKFHVADLSLIKEKLVGWQEQQAVVEVDQYWNAPDRDFAHTDEAFRIRTTNDKNILTYKGPKRDPHTKTRFELELPLGDGARVAAQWRELLTRLGYRPVGVVTKSRRVFRIDRDGFAVQASLDEVEEVGSYAELEILADESRFPQARGLILKLADELGLKTPERRSYLELLLHSQRTAIQLDVVSNISDLRRKVAAARRRGLTVGFVPTMGALHAGHAALIERARAECGYVVVSIFVNPTQFGPKEDFGKYPRTLPLDIELCRQLGVDLIFAPSTEAVYPPAFATFVEVGPLSEVFEGTIRPGHFRGVATVVLKLFNMVAPDIAYFGQKDAQQVAVIEQLVRDSDIPIQLRIIPTVREPDGLALSSRNRYLDPTMRKEAVVLSQALMRACEAVRNGERDSAVVSQLMKSQVATAASAKLDYAAIVDPKTFREPQLLSGPALAIIAARFGDTRLIDNMIVGGDA